MKEIIVSNIVERAKFMCNYEKSDDAFEAHYFEHGDCRNNGYDDYCNKYFAFKDRNFSDFSILVASSNSIRIGTDNKNPNEFAYVKKDSSTSEQLKRRKKRSFPKVCSTYEKPQLKIFYVSISLSPYSQTLIYQGVDGQITSCLP
ncbi:hypothetical protein [Neobacillus drentensis]|uniref:hypothetical protein n=1 Tax=Neobacillus drentensis TaxID=220684 RepID=UPI002FFEF3FD